MSYQVLARKWRPRSFSTLVGQDHVVRALSNALDTGRIHHAWLFTGTRGVGKTTLARILAKCLNCESGISSTPTDCSICQEIDEGRFVDYIEVDAASNRGVDEITPLLEQAVYPPSRGRFKIYTIDEVHMLSGHAFNAMLKTLEEPPPHLKFILATTDPQKIPVTVLSRCIQYNLKRMPPEAITSHLEHVLQQENIPCETAALHLIARAAAGSMRDALSLTDQAIAYSGSHITLSAMQDMLGTIDGSYLLQLLDALARSNAQEVLQIADALAERSFSFEGALSDLARLLSQIALEQKVPNTIARTEPHWQQMRDYASRLPADLLQLFYAIAVNGRGELSRAPDEYAGFVMICLRMLSVAESTPESGLSAPQTASISSAARADDPDASSDASDVRSEPLKKKAPLEVKAAPSTPGSISPQSPAPEKQLGALKRSVGEIPGITDGSPLGHEEAARSERNAAEASSSSEHQAAAASATRADEFPTANETRRPDQSRAGASPRNSPAQDSTPNAVLADHYHSELNADISLHGGSSADLNSSLIDQNPAPLAPETDHNDHIGLTQIDQSSWPQVVRELQLGGLAGELLKHSEWVKTEHDAIHLRIVLKNADSMAVKETITTALSEYFSKVVKIAFLTGQTGSDTVHAQDARQWQQRMEQAKADIGRDPFIQGLREQFSAQVVEDSIQLLNHAK